jgi:hypothetical protein
MKEFRQNKSKKGYKIQEFYLIYNAFPIRESEFPCIASNKHAGIMMLISA